MKKIFSQSFIPVFLNALLLSLALSACQPAEQSDTSAAISNGKNSPECLPRSPEVENPGFEFDYERGRPRGWLINQHAGDKTYIVETQPDGILEMNNFGMQYWMTLYQRFPAESLIGQEIEFSAEVKLNLDPTGWLSTLEPGGGLNIAVRGTEPGGTNRKALLYRAVMPDEPRHGQVDWRRFSHRFTVPVGANLLELGFLHQAHGKMWIRKPELRLIDPKPLSDCLEQP